MESEQSERKIVDWHVPVAGDDKLLSVLAEAFPGPDPRLWLAQHNRYRLFSRRFLELPAPREVMTAAEKLLTEMCGLLNIFANYIGEVWVVGAEWTDIDGKHGGISTSVLELNVVQPEAIQRLQRPSGHGQLNMATRILSLASEDPTLSTLLAVANSHRLSWGDLYLALELLEERLGGLKGISAFSGAPRKRLSRLQRTANSYRHATIQPPPDFRPMPINEATNLVCKLVCSWIEARLGE